MEILNGQWLDRFHRLGAKEGKEYGVPPAKKLSMLLRPAFVAPKDKTLLYGDWSNIEARVLPWLAASTKAEEKLEIFREIDKDPTKPDVYIRTAGDLLGLDPQEIWDRYKEGDAEADGWRQSHGKVPELSLGFGGGLGALQAMATNYGVYLDEQTARDMINRWRDANMWARMFWGSHGRDGSYGLWGAINSAMESPGTIFPVGRVAYVFDKSYLGGTLFCSLPCGRLLTYPQIKWEWREVEDKKTGKTEDRYQLTYRKAFGRKALWYGIAAENITQATAASILRRSVKMLELGELDDGTPLNVFMPIVMHTHDEVVTEVREEDMMDAAHVLFDVMTTNEDWDEGLPLAAEISTSWFYSKMAQEVKVDHE